MSRWIVDWEVWNYDENGKIIDIFGVSTSTKFTVEADSLEQAISLAESRAAEELCRVQKRIPENFAAASNSVPRILGLKEDEKGAYYEIRKAKTVFGGQITELPDYGSFE
jgi:hypothetical protein